MSKENLHSIKEIIDRLVKEVLDEASTDKEYPSFLSLYRRSPRHPVEKAKRELEKQRKDKTKNKGLSPSAGYSWLSVAIKPVLQNIRNIPVMKNPDSKGIPNTQFVFLDRQRTRAIATAEDILSGRVVVSGKDAKNLAQFIWSSRVAQGMSYNQILKGILDLHQEIMTS